jgi:hypothetical protein
MQMQKPPRHQPRGFLYCGRHYGGSSRGLSCFPGQRCPTDPALPKPVSLWIDRSILAGSDGDGGAAWDQWGTCAVRMNRRAKNAHNGRDRNQGMHGGAGTTVRQWSREPSGGLLEAPYGVFQRDRHGLGRSQAGVSPAICLMRRFRIMTSRVLRF